MPKIQGTIPAVRKRFVIAPTYDGYEVVDNEDGRAVSSSFEFSNEPLRIAGELNDAVARGWKHLALALGALDANEFDALMEEEADAFVV